MPQPRPPHLQNLRSPKHWLKRLTLGLLTTIITTWTGAYFIEAIRGPAAYLGPTRAQRPFLEVFRVDHFGSQAFSGMDVLDPEDSDFSFTSMKIQEIDGYPNWTRIPQLHATPTMHSNGYGMTHTDIAYGWPCLALSNTHDISLLGTRNNRAVEIKYGIDLGPFTPTTPESHRILPYKPIIPGLIINTLFYTLTIFTIPTLIFKTTRYHHRLKKNHCPICNYILNDPHQPRCPECAWQRPIPTPPSPTTPNQK